MNGGFKEFHLVAEPVVREVAPGFTAHLRGYNGPSPGPTIEVVEGDKRRLPRSGLVQASGGHHGVRMDGRAARGRVACRPQSLE